MPRSLIVKTSSLGDVVHMMPAIADMRAARPDFNVTWVIEEGFAPLVRLHPGVDVCIPVAMRRWRRGLVNSTTWHEIGAIRSHLGGQAFDAIIDTQGLLKSALFARMARGPRHGYDWRSAREPLSSLFYQHRHIVTRSQHAIDRNRALVAAALGYPLSEAWSYGLSTVSAKQPAALARGERYAIVLHGTAQPRKLWPDAHWRHIISHVADRGLIPVLPWGTDAEHERSLLLTEGRSETVVLPRMALDALARVIAGADLVVSVDTGLAHLAAALERPLVSIFGPTRPNLVRPRGSGYVSLLGGDGRFPDAKAVVDAIEDAMVQAGTSG
ncbi:MAG: lipopolysaccharide heptosyltransferase I [Pseudomonadota bacterium]